MIVVVGVPKEGSSHFPREQDVFTQSSHSNHFTLGSLNTTGLSLGAKR